ncbi:MAG TPA: symmetrical bis(5'-nucleosyl)-tetraphosphatase [Nitrospira sp.]|nr:symmetrical bis(5'-nucleosyl)-tetraphosphatase [Nitrospira sp.]
MPTYAIGDVQGCSKQLEQLLDRIRFDAQHDRVWFVGDLVNRGPESAGVLRLIKGLRASATVVLGNHDLFLLAAAEGIVDLRPKDTVHDVLRATDCQELVGWLRHRPLAHREGRFFMVHAGLLPQWTLDEAAALAREIQESLSGPDYRTFLKELFHGTIRPWSPALQGVARCVAAARVMTRIRTCTPSGELSNFSGGLDDVPEGFLPWFRIPGRRSRDGIVITGHWAALGLHFEQDHWGIDSGCVWGRTLTAVRLEDRALFHVEGLRR